MDTFEPTDFDPTTEEGRIDINDEVDKEYDTLLPKENEPLDDFYSRFRQKFGSRWRDAFNRFSDKWKTQNPDKQLPEYMELQNMDEDTEKVKEAKEVLKIRYPNFNFDDVSLFDDNGKVIIAIKYQKGNVEKQTRFHNLFDVNGEINKQLEKLESWKNVTRQNLEILDLTTNLNRKIEENEYLNQLIEDREKEYFEQIQLLQNSHGREKVAMQNNIQSLTEDISRLKNNLRINSQNEKILIHEINQKNEQLQQMEQAIEDLEQQIERQREIINDSNRTEEEIEAARQETIRLEERVAELNAQKDQLETELGLTLKEKIKRVFKKYGFTVAAVATAVAITIGVLVSQLKSGLSSVAKGVGNGLKTLGKKLGEMLPGMIGAIASFIFKTAGQVVSFVAEHAWLLIVAVVAFMIEKMKK